MLVLLVLAALLCAGHARGDGVRAVRTPQELQAAFWDGAKHVVINEHLDLSELAVFDGIGLDDGVLATKGTQTVRVRVRAPRPPCTGHAQRCAAQ